MPMIEIDLIGLLVAAALVITLVLLIWIPPSE